VLWSNFRRIDFYHVDFLLTPSSKQLRAAKTLSLAARVPKPVPGPMEAGERFSAVLELCFVYHAKGSPSFFLYKRLVA